MVTPNSIQEEIPAAASATRSLLGFALTYAKLGFRVLPVQGFVNGRCTCGKVCSKPGKHPAINHWHERSSRDPETLAAWFGYYAIGERNIGLHVGDEHVAIDVDFGREGKHGDQTLATLIAKHGALPETALARTGGGGEHYLFRKPKGVLLPGTLGEDIEVKTDNGYIVVEPSLHASGRRYEWEGAFDPIDGFPIAPAPQWMFEAPAVALPCTQSPQLTEQRVADIRCAIPFLKGRIDGYIDWRDIGMALHSTGGSKQALELWIEASRLSVHFNEDECRRTWRTFKLDRPNGIKLGTLFHKATEGGYVRPAGNVIELDKTRHLLNAPSPKLTIVSGPALPEVGQCPASRFAAFVDWIEGTYGLDHRGATAAAVSVVSAIAARRYRERTDVYSIVCGPDDARMRVERVVAAIVRGVGHGALLREQRIGTVGGLFEALNRYPARLYLTSDVSTQGETARKQNNGTLEHLWSEMARKLPHASEITVDNAGEAGLKRGEALTIHAPALSMLAAVDEARLEPLFNARSALRALVRAALWFDVAEESWGDSRLVEPENVGLGDWIVERAALVAPLPASTGLSACLDRNAGIPPVFGPGRDAVIDDAVLAPLTGGMLDDASRRLIRRVAFAVAAWESPAEPVATPELVAWTRALVERGNAERDEHTRVQENEDGRRAVGSKVLEFVGKGRDRGVAEYDVQKYVRSYRELLLEARNKVMDALEEDRAIVRMPGPRGGARLYLSKYVAESTPKAA